MSNVTGVVEWAGKNKFGGHSIRVDGNFYNSKFPIPCEQGDTVEFDSGSTGKYCNKLKVVSSGGGTTPSSGGGKTMPSRRGTFPIPKDDGQRSIIRQNALSRGVEIVALNPDGLEDREAMLTEAIRLAIEIERWTAGDLDAEEEEKAKAALSGS